MVIAAANTGKLAISRNAVINIDQVNNGMFNNLRFVARILNIVTMKFIAPINEDTPAQM